MTLAVGKGWWCIDWVTVVEGRHIWDVARILGETWPGVGGGAWGAAD